MSRWTRCSASCAAPPREPLQNCELMRSRGASHVNVGRIVLVMSWVRGDSLRQALPPAAGPLALPRVCVGVCGHRPGLADDSSSASFAVPALRSRPPCTNRASAWVMGSIAFRMVVPALMKLLKRSSGYVRRESAANCVERLRSNAECFADWRLFRSNFRSESVALGVGLTVTDSASSGRAPRTGHRRRRQSHAIARGSLEALFRREHVVAEERLLRESPAAQKAGGR